MRKIRYCDTREDLGTLAFQAHVQVLLFVPPRVFSGFLIPPALRTLFLLPLLNPANSRL